MQIITLYTIMNKRAFLLYFVTIILISVIVFFAKDSYPFMDVNGLIGGNVTLAAISILSYRMIMKGLKNDNPQAFVRAKYGGTMLKFFACIIIIGLYILLNREHLEKMNVFILLGFYIIYAIIEAGLLTKAAQKPIEN